MGRKRVIVGQSEWGIDDERVDETIKNIKEALETGSMAELHLLNSVGRPVRVYLNGRTVQTVVVDLDSEPKPSEISVGTNA